jgi:hypothetical protein
MGGFVPGPVIRFTVDAPGLSQAVAPAMQDVKNQARATSQAIADDWRRMAAQMRAATVQGAMSQRDLNSVHGALVVSLDKEINLLRQRETLTNRELASLKAMTLERERQASALKNGGPGITRGTEQALGQVSTQTTLGIERMVDSLVNRYMGGAAGALTRTLRDVSYYSMLATGGTSAGGGGILSGFTGGLSKLAEMIPAQTLLVGGFATAIGALGIAGATAAHHLEETAQSINNVSAATGLSATQVQVYSELAKEMGLDANSITMEFARLQSQIGEFITKGKGADESSQALIKVLSGFGISVKDAQGHVRDINSILEDFADVTDQVGDKNARTALRLEAFGTRGRIVAQMMNQATLEGKSFRDVLQEISGSNVIIPQSQIDSLQAAKVHWDELTRTARGYVTVAEEILAKGFLAVVPSLPESVTHIPADRQQSPYATLTPAQRAAMSGTLTPGQSFTFGVSQADIDAVNAKLLKQAEIIKDGGKNQYDLAQAEKNYAEAVKDGQGAIAEQYAKQIASLQNIVGLEKSRAEIAKRFRDELFKDNTTSHPNEKDQTLDFLLQRLTGGTPAQQARALAGALPTAPTPGAGLYGALGPLGSGAPSNEEITAQAQKVHQELIDLNMSAEDKIRQQYNQEPDYWKFIQQQFPIYAQEASNAIIDIKKIEAQKLQELADKAFEKYKNEAGQLFESLISGNTKDFSKKLQKDIEDAVLEPFKDAFEESFGKMLQSVAGIFSGSSSGTSGSTPVSSASQSISQAIAKLGNFFGLKTSPNAPGGTAGTFPGSIGVSGSGSGTAATLAAHLATQAMYVQAQTVYLNGGGVGSGSGPAGSSGGVGGFTNPGVGSDFLANNNTPFGISSFYGNNNPFSGNGPLASYGNGSQNPMAKLLSSTFGQDLTSIAPGLLMGGLAALSGNTPAQAIAAGTTASSLVKAFGNPTYNAKGQATNFAGKLGQGFQGAGLLAAGISQGGVTGGLEDVAGGAQIGTAIAPGIGTAIGAAVGAMIGIVNGIFGANSWQDRVKAAMNNQAIYLPPSENFSFASNGSIGSTLSTGFSQSGQTFSQYGINQPFYANAIYGPLTNAQKLQLAQTELGMNSNQPFLGFPNSSTNPFEGGSIPGYKAYPTSPMPYIGNAPLGFNPPMSQPAPEIHFHIPNYVDQHSASFVFKNLAPAIADAVAPHLSRSIYTSSSGMSNGVRTAVNLP